MNTQQPTIDPSGLLQIDGSVDLHDLGQEEANRSPVACFIETVLIAGQTERTAELIDGEAYGAHFVIVASSSAGRRTRRKLIAMANPQPGTPVRRPFGNGTAMHLSSQWFPRMAGVNCRPFP